MCYTNDKNAREFANKFSILIIFDIFIIFVTKYPDHPAYIIRCIYDAYASTCISGTD